jgi:hypothetical protein
VALLKIKSINIVIPTYFEFIQMPIIKTKIGIFMHPYIYVMQYSH